MTVPGRFRTQLVIRGGGILNRANIPLDKSTFKKYLPAFLSEWPNVGHSGESLRGWETPDKTNCTKIIYATILGGFDSWEHH